MHIQQKFQLSNREIERIPDLIKKVSGNFVRSTLDRDLIFTPDSRAYKDQFIERFALVPIEKGLYLRLREENDLTAGKGNQNLALQAYLVENQIVSIDHLKTYFDSDKHKLSDVIRMLELLGIDKVVEVTKKRDAYSLVFEQFAFEIYLDHVDHVVTPFVEIHTNVDKAEKNDLLDTLLNLHAQLRLDPNDISLIPYYQMILKTRV